jgi:uncharacterized membrane protein (UPF0127 family)
MKKKEYLLHLLSRPEQPPLRVLYCASFLCRLRGLMFRRSLPPNYGWLLVESKDSRLDTAIHMLFMRLDLAAVWINSQGEVVDVRLARRWRPAYIPRRPARYILETSADRYSDFSIGDQVRLEELV